MNCETLYAMWEKYYPQIVGVFAAVSYYFWGDKWFAPRDPSALLTTVVTLAGIATAFLATVKTYVISNPTFKALTALRVAGQFKLFVNYIRRANELSFILCAASAIPMMICFKTVPPYGVLLLKSVWIFLLVWTAASTWRVVRLFGRILSKET